jgi:hypothetical protein
MPATPDRPAFNDWRDAAGEDAVAIFMEAVERVRPLVPDLAKIHPDAPAIVMRLALEQVAPIAADEVELRTREALAKGWRPAR